MPYYKAMKKSIYRWIDSQALVDSSSIVWMFQNDSVPGKPFFSYLIMSMTQIGDADFIAATSGESDERDMITNQDFVVEILGFGQDIIEKTTALKNSLNLPDVHNTLKDDGIISWNNTEAVQDISGVDGNENEERSSYDAFMRTTDRIINIPVGEISILNSQGTFKQPGKPDIIQTVNVDST